MAADGLAAAVWFFALAGNCSEFAFGLLFDACAVASGLAGGCWPDGCEGVWFGWFGFAPLAAVGLLAGFDAAVWLFCASVACD